MPSWHKSREQMIDCNKQPLAFDNEKTPRKISNKAGKTHEKERECEKFTIKETSIDVGLDQQAKAKGSGEEEEEGVDDGSNSTQLKRNKKNWKHLAR